MEPSDRIPRKSDLPDKASEPKAESPGDQTLAFRTTGGRGLRKRVHPSLVVIQGREIGREYRLRRSRVILGRDEGAHIAIPDEGVSRRHLLFELSWDADRRLQGILIQDLESTNGTHLNGERVERVALREGDKIQVGDTILKYVLHDGLDARFHREVHNRIAYDQLTGLLTKEFLYVAMETELKRCRKYDLPMSVVMMDLDHFKQVNDQHGHLMGSHVLSEVGRLIREGTRGTDVAARYGGEEFLAYLPEVDREGGRLAAERIRTAVAGHIFTRLDESGRSTTLHATLSLGVAQFPQHGTSVEALVAAADAALYRAKEEGRNRVALA